jgi:hypothetical protein
MLRIKMHCGYKKNESKLLEHEESEVADVVHEPEPARRYLAGCLRLDGLKIF